jgi:transposase
MAYTPKLNSQERLRIVEALRRGNRSHRELASEFNRAQSTISKIARDAGITSTHRRKRTPAALGEVESTYDKQARVALEDRFLSALDSMITDGGLSPRDAREIAQAAKVVLDARRSEDVREPEDEKANRTEWVSFEGMGEMAYDPNTKLGREMIKLEEEWDQEEDAESPGKEYGSPGGRTTLD